MKDYPCKRENPRGLHNLESVAIAEDMASTTPRIYVMLQDQQADN